MKHFFDEDWWKNTTGAMVGTIIGIVLTFGTTFYFDNRNKADMARKTVMITLHNLDAAIDNMDALLKELQQDDSLYARVSSLMPDQLGQLGNDSLEMFINKFGSLKLHMTDQITNSIFSNSFEVWQYLDDEKVIGRIGNCYTLLQVCHEEYEKIENLRLSAFEAYWNERPPTDYPDLKQAVQALMKRNDVRFVLNKHITIMNVLKFAYNLTYQLHKRNKQVLRISQDELDEVGNLLEQNSYNANFEDVEKP